MFSVSILNLQIPSDIDEKDTNTMFPGTMIYIGWCLCPMGYRTELNWPTMLKRRFVISDRLVVLLIFTDFQFSLVNNCFPYRNY